MGNRAHRGTAICIKGKNKFKKKCGVRMIPARRGRPGDRKRTAGKRESDEGRRRQVCGREGKGGERQGNTQLHRLGGRAGLPARSSRSQKRRGEGEKCKRAFSLASPLAARLGGCAAVWGRGDLFFGRFLNLAH